jgi:hypothetical protein
LSAGRMPCAPSVPARRSGTARRWKTRRRALADAAALGGGRSLRSARGQPIRCLEPKENSCPRGAPPRPETQMPLVGRRSNADPRHVASRRGVRGNPYALRLLHDLTTSSAIRLIRHKRGSPGDESLRWNSSGRPMLRRKLNDRKDLWGSAPLLGEAEPGVVRRRSDASDRDSPAA